MGAYLRIPGTYEEKKAYYASIEKGQRITRYCLGVGYLAIVILGLILLLKG